MVKVRTGLEQGWNPESGADAEAMEACYLRAGSPWFVQSALLQNPGPPAQGGTTHHKLGPPLLITNQENALQLDLMETFPQLRLLPLMTLACVKLTHKTTQDSRSFFFPFFKRQSRDPPILLPDC